MTLSRRPARLLALLAATTVGLVLPAAPAQAAGGNVAVSFQEPFPVQRGDATIVTVSLEHGEAETPARVAVDVTLPAGLELDQVLAPDGVTCDVLRCMATVAPFHQVDIDVKVYALTAGDQVVTATLTHETPDTDPADDRASLTLPVGPGDGRQLTVGRLPGEIGFGDRVELKGRITLPSGAAVVGEFVTLETRPPGGTSWTAGDGTRTDDTGAFAVDLPTDRAVDVRVGTDNPRLRSPVLQVRPVVRPLLTLDPVRLPPGGSGRVIMSFAGPVAGRTITLQKAVSGGWQTLTTRNVTKPGTIPVAISRLAAGTYRFRAVLSGTGAVPSRDAVLPVSLKGYGDGRAYAFSSVHNGAPARWDPCRTITWKVNARRAPAGGVGDLHESFRRLAQVTGLTFRYGGSTGQVPGGSPRQTDEFVAAWASPQESRYFPQGGFYGPAGVGGFSATSTPSGRFRITSGFVVLNAAQRFSPGFGGGATQGALQLHELAHAVGLDHVDSAGQIMLPTLDNDAPVAMWGAGDLNGLHRLGKAQGCLRG